MTVKLSVRESKVEAYLVQRVQALGGRCDKVQVIGRRGFFDRLVVLPGGRILFVELKRPRGGRMTAHQWRYAESYRALGAAVALVKNAADIDALLKNALAETEGVSSSRPNLKIHPSRGELSSAKTIPF
jgi:hypothetical protein